MGSYPPHGPVPEGVPEPGDKETDSEAPMAESERKVRKHLGGGGKSGGGVLDDRDMQNTVAQYIVI